MMPRVALAAVAWCFVFAVAHIFWALGGSAGLASSAGADLAARRPAAFVILGLWGVAGLLLGAAVAIVAVATGRFGSRGVWAIGIVGSGLLVRGVALEVVLATDTGGIRAAVGPLETRWSLLLWNPWFVLGGALFIGTGVLLLERVRTAKLSQEPADPHTVGPGHASDEPDRR